MEHALISGTPEEMQELASITNAYRLFSEISPGLLETDLDRYALIGPKIGRLARLARTKVRFVGVYDTYEEGMAAGTEEFGDRQFLVQKIIDYSKFPD